MSDTYSASQALALELVNAVLSETIFEWCSRRLVRGRKDAFKLFFCNNSKHREEVSKELLREFADSMIGLRVTSSLQNRLIPGGDEHSEGTPVRFVDFTIGRDGNESVAVVRVVLHEQHGDPLVSVTKRQAGHWSSWQPSMYNAFDCIRHPNEKLKGKIILGRLATR